MFRSPVLVTIALLIAISAHAQLTTLYDFLPTPSSRSPQATLVTDGTYFYGMTMVGGPGSIGTIYKIKPDGTGYVQLLDFDGSLHGRAPNGGLLFDGTFLYGMTATGGTTNRGVIFKILTDGTGYVKLFENFDGPINGANPGGTLISDGTFLYGMTENGGASDIGTVFKIKTDGTGFQKLHEFVGPANGSTPVADLVYDGTFLYGMTKLGGTGSQGTLFKIKSDGTGFLKLKDFTVGVNGELPLGSPILIGTTLYGMTELGGTSGDGNVFKINTDGSGYTNITNLSLPIAQDPVGGLLYDGTYFYGTSLAGGVEGRGSLFRINFDGSGLVKLADFQMATTGGDPSCTPLLFNGLLYGVTPSGGDNGFGTLFRWGTPAGGITITTQPSSVPVCEGQIATFTTGANGTTNITYQWQFSTDTNPSNFTDVPVGAGYTNVNTASLGINTTGVFGAGYYRCKVDGDLAPTVFSNPALLTINPNPAAPVVTGSSGCSPSILTLHASGTTDGNYRWYTQSSGGTAVVGAVSGSFTTPSLTSTTSWFVSIMSGTCESPRTSVVATITSACPSTQPPTISTPGLSVEVGGLVSVDLVQSITTPNNNLDANSIQITVPPGSGATATIVNGMLTIDYTGVSFTGTETITITACDLNSNCSTKDLIITVEGDIFVYNAVSPGGSNPILFIKNITLIPDAKDNKVMIFDRWQNLVWHGSDYDNSSQVFSGVSDDGRELPTGSYYYRIEFESGRKSMTGFISLRR